ncbi:efflux transporter outer membrane subunit [Paralcaligenes sp. KSB-10]|uniref:efflux transporter outer membrane subunit n=1 Tax=Paralcaligenes sp. KSB-10 TaxID=2901142 RepID=UPI001E3C6335|nr:efflux transporter outer membrane subunit [Paralcaligenes sp. KSB-10]UHL63991.1 efflux transporter outer membrane subunit [Paralcaligenes sp. KSB-10]
MVNLHKKILRNSALVVLTALLGACAVGPNYQRPTVSVGNGYKEAKGWKLAQPGDTGLRADWWRSYNDSVLNGLMDGLLASNQNIAQAEAQYRQAQALVKSARAGFFPTVTGGLSSTRSGSRSPDTGSGSSSSKSSQSELSGAVSWEPDIWGKVRRSVESSRAGLEASAADVAATRLSMQSTLAQTYFNLRALDAEKRLYVQTLAAYQRSLTTTENRYHAGVAAQADVEAARTQLENARTDALALEWQRAQYEHALAVLTGQAPSSFALAPDQTVGTVPEIPVGLPSQLLERRPDVAAAERRTAEANAKIGVAQAAWFPDLTLSASGGFSNSQLALWLAAPASFWSLGPALAMTLFDGGARQANIEQSRAAYDAQVAAYRSTVLGALQEVENYLVQLSVMAREQQTQDRALASARESLRLTENQYQAGIIDYLSVAQVETTALSTERSALALRAARLVASVQLIAALGGGWQVPQPADNHQASSK